MVFFFNDYNQKMLQLQSLKKITIDTLHFVDFLWLNKSDLHYQGEFCKGLWKSFPLMVLDAKIDDVMTEKKASKVFSHFSGLLLQVPTL